MVINEALLSKLANEYGDAFYLLNSAQFQKNFQGIKGRL
jgi:diaminopimelate decarboxylase